MTLRFLAEAIMTNYDDAELFEPTWRPIGPFTKLILSDFAGI